MQIIYSMYYTAVYTIYYYNVVCLSDPITTTRFTISVIGYVCVGGRKDLGINNPDEHIHCVVIFSLSYFYNR